MILIQNDMLLGKRITLPFFVLEKIVKICYNNQHEFVINNGGPWRADCRKRDKWLSIQNYINTLFSHQERKHSIIQFNNKHSIVKKGEKTI